MIFFRIDDIQDNSILRRGIPVAHSVYGIASSLSAANYVLFIALERVINLQHPAVSRHKIKVNITYKINKLR